MIMHIAYWIRQEKNVKCVLKGILGLFEESFRERNLYNETIMDRKRSPLMQSYHVAILYWTILQSATLCNYIAIYMKLQKTYKQVKQCKITM